MQSFKKQLLSYLLISCALTAPSISHGQGLSLNPYPDQPQSTKGQESHDAFQPDQAVIMELLARQKERKKLAGSAPTSLGQTIKPYAHSEANNKPSAPVNLDHLTEDDVMESQNQKDLLAKRAMEILDQQRGSGGGRVSLPAKTPSDASSPVRRKQAFTAKPEPQPDLTKTAPPTSSLLGQVQRKPKVRKKVIPITEWSDHYNDHSHKNTTHPIVEDDQLTGMQARIAPKHQGHQGEALQEERMNIAVTAPPRDAPILKENETAGFRPFNPERRKTKQKISQAKAQQPLTPDPATAKPVSPPKSSKARALKQPAWAVDQPKRPAMQFIEKSPDALDPPAIQAVSDRSALTSAEQAASIKTVNSKELPASKLKSPMSDKPSQEMTLIQQLQKQIASLEAKLSEPKVVSANVSAPVVNEQPETNGSSSKAPRRRKVIPTPAASHQPAGTLPKPSHVLAKTSLPPAPSSKVHNDVEQPLIDNNNQPSKNNGHAYKNASAETLLAAEPLFAPTEIEDHIDKVLKTVEPKETPELNLALQKNGDNSQNRISSLRQTVDALDEKASSIPAMVHEEAMKRGLQSQAGMVVPSSSSQADFTKTIENETRKIVEHKDQIIAAETAPAIDIVMPDIPVAPVSEVGEALADLDKGDWDMKKDIEEEIALEQIALLKDKQRKEKESLKRQAARLAQADSLFARSQKSASDTISPKPTSAQLRAPSPSSMMLTQQFASVPATQNMKSSEIEIAKTAAATEPNIAPQAIAQPPLVEPQAPSSSMQWSAEKGQSAYAVLSQWSRNAGVDLIWNSQFLVDLHEDVLISGSYEDAVQSVLMQYDGLNAGVHGSLFVDDVSGKKTLVIETNQG